MTADAINKKIMISTIPYFLYISPDDNLVLFFIFRLHNYFHNFILNQILTL